MLNFDHAFAVPGCGQAALAQKHLVYISLLRAKILLDYHFQKLCGVRERVDLKHLRLLRLLPPQHRPFMITLPILRNTDANNGGVRGIRVPALPSEDSHVL
jgi:hypothetical protein